MAVGFFPRVSQSVSRWPEQKLYCLLKSKLKVTNHRFFHIVPVSRISFIHARGHYTTIWISGGRTILEAVTTVLLIFFIACISSLDSLICLLVDSDLFPTKMKAMLEQETLIWLIPESPVPGRVADKISIVEWMNMWLNHMAKNRNSLTCLHFF